MSGFERINNNNNKRIYKLKGIFLKNRKKNFHDNYKYRLSKRIKYKSKNISIGFIKKICIKPIGIIDLLIKIGIYKKVLLLKLLFILIPFVFLIITDNFTISVVITTINIFCCYFVFSISVIEKNKAIVDGKFDYGKYKYLKSRYETISILLMFFISSILIIVGHYFLTSIIQILTGLVVDV